MALSTIATSLPREWFAAAARIVGWGPEPFVANMLVVPVPLPLPPLPANFITLLYSPKESASSSAVTG